MFRSKIYKTFFPIITEEEFRDFCYFYRTECLDIIDSAILDKKYELMKVIEKYEYKFKASIYIRKINKELMELELLRCKCMDNLLNIDDVNFVLKLSNENMQKHISIFRKVFILVSLLFLFFL